MVNLGITVGVLFVGLLMLAVFGFWWVSWQRNKHYREAENHIKGIFFAPGISQPIEVILEVEASGVEVKAPKGHHIGVYFINRESKYDTMYPSNPPLGIKAVQVPIGTQWWGLDNPEPLCAHEHKQIATASRIFASGDNSFMFMFRQAKMELDKERQELAKLLKSKLNASYVYIGGIIMLLMIAGLAFGLFQVIGQLAEIAKAVGAK